MATVVYLQPSNRWESIQKGFDNLMGGIKQFADARNTQALQNSTMETIKNAPDRATAQDAILKAMSNPRTKLDPSWVRSAGAYIDTTHPPGENDPQVHTGYDSTTGKPFDYVMPKKDAAAAQNKDVVSFITERDPNTFTLGKAPQVKEYVDPKTGKSVGNFVPGMNQPEFVTKDDFERNRQIEADSRAVRNQERSDRNQERMDERLRLAQEAGDRANARMGQVSDELRQGRRQAQIEKSQMNFKSTLAETYNVKKYPDGSLDMSDMDVNKKKQFMEALDKGMNGLDTGEYKNAGQAFRGVKGDLDKPAPKGDDAQPGGLPKGAKLSSDVTEVKTKDGKTVKAKKVLDANGKLLGYQPVEQ